MSFIKNPLEREVKVISPLPPLIRGDTLSVILSRAKNPLEGESKIHIPPAPLNKGGRSFCHSD